VPRLVCADNDPYCDPPARLAYSDAFDVDLVGGAGHFDMTAGYGPWWSVLRWCENPGYRLEAS